MILPEEIFQHSQQHFHAYRPIIEELFEVDLSDLLLKDTEGYLLDMLADRSASINNGEVRQVILNYLALARVFGKYWEPMCSVYVFPRRPMDEQEVARTIVHELGHAAHYSLIRQDQAVELNQQPLWAVIQEGFANYLSMKLFVPFYDIDGMEKFLTGCSECYASTVARERDRIKLEGIVKARIDNHAWGWHFFKTAADAGVSPIDIIRNPPPDLETIINPADYIKEMSS